MMAANSRGRIVMRQVATATDRIDYWIRRRIVPCDALLPCNANLRQWFQQLNLRLSLFHVIYWGLPKPQQCKVDQVAFCYLRLVPACLVQGTAE
jgi:hypothetical protein